MEKKILEKADQFLFLSHQSLIEETKHLCITTKNGETEGKKYTYINILVYRCT